jgi:bifunctional non-homologous end joining protein LigD
VDREISFPVCDSLDALLYLVNLGCIDLNPWHSRVASLDRPDYLLLDLDAKTAGFPAVLKVALEARRMLEELRLESRPKTSGQTGMHICLPLGASYSYRQARALAEGLMRALNRRLPELTSVELHPERRQGRVYLDFLQNHKGKTMAAPYTVRPVAGATVSTPLDWSELTPDLDPSAFTLVTAPGRFRRVGDLWAPVLGPAIDLPAALEHLREAGHGEAPERSQGA